MVNYLTIIYIFGLIMIIRFILYCSNYFYLKKVITKQNIYVKGLYENPSEDEIKKSNKAGAWVNDNIMEIKRIVLKTGVADYVHTFMEPVGYGNVQQKTMSALDNILFKNIEILKEARDILHRAKGYYKVETLKCINPIYWIEFIVFLPREIIRYFSTTNDSKPTPVLTNIIQILYWLISIVFTYLNYIKGK